MNSPTVSICMPNYNDAQFLPAALEAFLQQSYLPLEIIVIDDHSTDSSVEVLEAMAARHPIIKLYRNERNIGPADTSARMTELAQGDYVLYTSANDVVLPKLLEKSIAVLTRYPQAGLCSSGMFVIDETGRSKGVLHHSIASKAPRYFSPDEMRELIAKLGYEGWFYAANTAIYKRAAVIEARGFRKELHAFADGFLATVVALQRGACHVPTALGAWREDAGSYGGTSWADPETAPAMVQAATELIETEYAGLFPDGYVAQMRDVLRVKLRLGELARRDQARREQLAGSGLGRSPLGGVLVRGLAVAQELRAGVTQVWLRLRLGLPVRTRLVWKLKDLIGRLRPAKIY